MSSNQISGVKLLFLDLVHELYTVDCYRRAFTALESQRGRTRCLILRLFKYLLDRMRTRRGNSPDDFISVTARCEAA